MRNKRGQGISMELIVITIIVIIVLVIVAVFFGGSMSNLSNKIKGLFGSQLTDFSTSTNKCNNICIQYENTQSEIMSDRFCNEKFDVDINADSKISDDEKGKTCETLKVPCSAITC